MEPSSSIGPSGGSWPSSSRNSRHATSSLASPGSISPFGRDHAPSSLRFQNGPPGWMSNTSRRPPRTRYRSSPADSLLSVSTVISSRCKNPLAAVGWRTFGVMPYDESKKTWNRFESDIQNLAGELKRAYRKGADEKQTAEIN